MCKAPRIRFEDVIIEKVNKQTQSQSRLVQESGVSAGDWHGLAAGDYVTGVLAEVRCIFEYFRLGVHDEHPLSPALNRNLPDYCAGVFGLSRTIKAGLRAVSCRDGGFGDNDRRQVLAH